MQGLVDIHAHLLPGIDDGPDTLEEALEMARAAVEAGIETIAVTPHLRIDFPDVHVEEIGQRCMALAGALRDAEIPLQLQPGAEASLVWALHAPDEHLRMATYGQRGECLLIETPGQATMLENLLDRLQAKGLRIVLAHPERSPELRRAPERLERLVEQGILLQVNAEALLARRPRGLRSLAERLCRDGLAAVLASDGHRARDWRPVTALAEAVDVAARLVGDARTSWMTSGVPKAIADGGPLPPAPALDELAPRRGLLRRR